MGIKEVSRAAKKKHLRRSVIEEEWSIRQMVLVQQMKVKYSMLISMYCVCSLFGTGESVLFGEWPCTIHTYNFILVCFYDRPVRYEYQIEIIYRDFYKFISITTKNVSVIFLR